MYKTFAIIAVLLFGVAIVSAIFGDAILFSIYCCTSIILVGIAYIILEVEN